MPKTNPHKKPATMADVERAKNKAYQESVRAAECKYNVGVICGLWEKDPGRRERCNWNPDKGKTKEE